MNPTDFQIISYIEKLNHKNQIRQAIIMKHNQFSNRTPNINKKNQEIYWLYKDWFFTEPKLSNRLRNYVYNNKLKFHENLEKLLWPL